MRFTNYKFHPLFILHDPSAETSNIIESLIYQDLEVWLDRINLTQETTTTLKSINFVTNNVHDKVYMNEVGRAIDAVVQPSAPTASLLPPRASSRVKPARIPRCHVEVLFIVARERPVSEPSSVFFFPPYSRPIIAASYYVGSFSGGERSRSWLDKGHSRCRAYGAARQPRYGRNISDNAAASLGCAASRSRATL